MISNQLLRVIRSDIRFLGMGLDARSRRLWVNSATLQPHDHIYESFPDADESCSVDASDLLEQLTETQIADCIIGPIPMKRAISRGLGRCDRQAKRLVPRFAAGYWRGLPFMFGSQLDAGCQDYKKSVSNTKASNGRKGGRGNRREK